MSEVVSFTGYVPPPRFDAVPWSEVRIEEGPASGGPWTQIDVVALAPLDSDPSNPASRSFTTSNGTGPELWYRVTFADAGGGTSNPSTPVQNLSATQTNYVNEAELRSMLTLQGTIHADYDIERAIAAVNPAINALCNRKFDKQTPVGQTETRFFRPQNSTVCHFDDLLEVVEFRSDQVGTLGYDHLWEENNDFVLAPYNAATDGWPYTYAEVVLLNASVGFPWWGPRSIRIEGRWGWASVPEDIIAAAYLLASRLIKRWRQAPLAVVTVGTDVGSAIRVGRDDPDVMRSIKDYVRERIV